MWLVCECLMKVVFVVVWNFAFWFVTPDLFDFGMCVFVKCSFDVCECCCVDVFCPIVMFGHRVVSFVWLHK